MRNPSQTTTKLRAELYTMRIDDGLWTFVSDNRFSPVRGEKRKIDGEMAVRVYFCPGGSKVDCRFHCQFLANSFRTLVRVQCRVCVNFLSCCVLFCLSNFFSTFPHTHIHSRSSSSSSTCTHTHTHTARVSLTHCLEAHLRRRRTTTTTATTITRSLMTSPCTDN